MKLYIFSVLLALTFVFTGLQAVFLSADAAAYRGKAAPPEALPAELKNLDVQDDFIDSGAQQAGFLQTVIGHVVVLHEDSGEAFFAAAGDAVFKHDIIFTLADSRCRIKFTTEDVITMGESAKLGLEEYIDSRPRKKKKSIFNMLRGKAMFYAVRLFKYRTRSTVVKTPTAVVGVRGTKFGVEVRMVSDKIATGQPIYLADASGSVFPALLAADPLATEATETTVYLFSGRGLSVFSPADRKTTELGEKQKLGVTPDGAGQVQDVSAQEEQQFGEATKADAPATTAEAGKKAAKKPADQVAAQRPPDTGATDAKDTSAIDKADDATSKTTDIKIAGEQQTRPTVHKGYFTGMLTHQPSGPYLDNVYVSSSRQNFDSTLVSAKGLYNPNGPNFVDGKPGSGFGDPLLKKVSLDTGSAIVSSADNLNYSITHGELGFNSYQEWGWWYVAVQTIEINGYAHDLFHKNYYIFGDPTPDTAVAGISGTYSGNAWGTYWDSTTSAPGGIDMTGTFSCTVSSSSISDFDLKVDGGGKYAEISNGTGTISSSEFAITGTFDLNGDSPPAVGGVAFGSLYGPNGEYIGGAWGMKENSSNGAQGVFQGAKQ